MSSIKACCSFVLLSLFFADSHACDYPNVKDEIKISHREKSYENVPKLFDFEIVAPVSINGWTLNGITFHEKGNNIPLRETPSEVLSGDAGYSIFSLSLVPDSVKNSHLSIIYWPPGVSVIEKPVCLLVEKLKYGI